LTLIITNGLPVTRIPRSFAFLGEGNLLGVPFVLWVVVICALATHGILEHTRLGRYAFAIGSNPDAAVYAGVPVAFDITVIYALGGLLTGLAGMIEASRLMTGQPSAGNGYELQAIAAVVIGGGSLHGGEGGVVGTLIGALIMGLLSNGSDLLGISPYLQQAIIGEVIILTVTVDEMKNSTPDWPKSIGYLGGAFSSLDVVLISRPSGLIEALKIGGAAGVAGFFVTYGAALAASFIFDVSRRQPK
jgi:ribose/xylose/arabinose/galactoside ABC-type transport system permease subunit